MSHAFKYHAREPSKLSVYKYISPVVISDLSTGTLHRPHTISDDYTSLFIWDSLDSNSTSYYSRRISGIPITTQPLKYQIHDYNYYCDESVCYNGYLDDNFIKLLRLIKENERRKEERKSWLLKILEQVLQRR